MISKKFFLLVTEKLIDRAWDTEAEKRRYLKWAKKQFLIHPIAGIFIAFLHNGEIITISSIVFMLKK